MEESKIQWTDATWNPWHGCKKVSAGCKYCYMFRDKETRYGQDPTIVVQSKTKFNDPVKWELPRMIFTCSWSDWFIDEADGWRDAAWKIIKETPHHTYQILTKRPERIYDHLPDDWGEGYPNVWLGVSVENNTFKKRINILEEIPAKIRFVSFEPLIGAIWLLDHEANNIQWAILGGESGNETGKYTYRPSELVWFDLLMVKLRERKVPIFVKQLGTHLAKEYGLKDRHGGDINEWPNIMTGNFTDRHTGSKPLDYRIREFPNTKLA